MYIHKSIVAGEEVLYLGIISNDEMKSLNEFTAYDEPLTAKLILIPGCVFPHIEIRKAEK